MSSRSEGLQRGGAVLLLTALLAGSAVTYRGVLPFLGEPPVPAAMSHPVDRATALLAQAKRPYDQVTFCETLKAYVPNLVPLAQGGVHVDAAPTRPVILCGRHARDLGLAVAHAGRDGLSWVRRIADADVIVFARDEAGFRTALAAAGVERPPSNLLPFDPGLNSLRSDAPGVVADDGGWNIAPRADDGLVLYGPYVDLAPGSYRVRFHARLLGSAAQCREAAGRYRPSIAVTQDTGRGGLQPKAPATVVVDKGDPCTLTVEDAFAVAAGGAKAVETPLSGATTLPMRIDGYALAPVAAAQSR